MAALRILVVNDEAPLAEALREGLAEAGYDGVGTTDRQILAHVERTGERRLDAVQAARSCGSGCGSCRAEVTRLIEATPSPTARIA